jgi:hypothetical protein
MGVRVSEVKQPREVLLKGINFTGNKKLVEGDSLQLSGSSVIITDQDDEDVSSEMLVTNSLTVSPSDNTIYAFIKGGFAGKEYKITFLAATVLGELLEEDIILPVEEL